MDKQKEIISHSNYFGQRLLSKYEHIVLTFSCSKKIYDTFYKKNSSLQNRKTH